MLPLYSKINPSFMCLRDQAHQAVQAPSQKVHRTHLHGGDLGNIDWRAQVQVEQVTQQVTLARNHMWLVHGSCWPTTHWALTCINAIIVENRRLVRYLCYTGVL